MAMDETNLLIEQRREELTSLCARGIDHLRNKFNPTKGRGAATRALCFEGREVTFAGPITTRYAMSWYWKRIPWSPSNTASPRPAEWAWGLTACA